MPGEGLDPSEILVGPAYATRRDRIQARLAACRARRRLPLPDAVLLFESRQTVIGHIQEIAFVEGRSSPRALAWEIAHYACLVPEEGRITATLMIQGGPPAAAEELARAFGRGEPALQLGADGAWIAARPLAPALPGDPVHYVAFDLPSRIWLAGARHLAVRLELGGTCNQRELPPRLRDELVQASPAIAPV